MSTGHHSQESLSLLHSKRCFIRILALLNQFVWKQ